MGTIIALLGLIIVALGIFAKVVSVMTRLENYMKETKHVVRRVPLLEWRVGHIERHLDLSVPEMPMIVVSGEDHDGT